MSALTKEDETLIASNARMESKLELLKTKLREQSRAKEEQEQELLQGKIQADLDAQRWKKAAEAHNKQLQYTIKELYTDRADHHKMSVTFEELVAK